MSSGDFPGGPVLKTMYFQRRGCGFHPYLANQDPICPVVWPGEKKKSSV